MPEVTVVTNARVTTMARDKPEAEAFAYDAKGTILAVGTEDQVLDEVDLARDEVGRWIDLEGAAVFPGFVDSHVHVPEAGINEELCLLPPEESLATYVSLITECAEDGAATGDDDWVRAAGASLFGLRDSKVLPIEALDKAVPNRPVMVLDDLGHAAWTNSEGLRRAGITADSPNPQGGVLHRDPKTGRLSGLLLEDAQQPLRNAAKPSAETIDAGLELALETLASNGVTTISDAGGYWQQGHTDAWERAAEGGHLSVRAANALYLYPPVPMEEQLAEFERRFDDGGSDLLQINTAKVYVDGILDLGTARMLQPYDQPVDPTLPSGFDYFKPEDLRTYVARLHELGFRINFHVIGDAAVHQALDAIEAIPAAPAEIAARRHRLTHTYLVDDADLDRFETLGVVADFQVGPESTDVEYHDYLSEFIGDRAYGLIPVDKVLATGALVTLSSDWDADPLSPLGIISRAMTRESHAITELDAALRAVTIDAATSLGLGEVTGSIEVGKAADFVVLDDDLYDLDPEEIADVEVLATYLAGREVYAGD